MPATTGTKPLSVTLDQVYTFPDSITALKRGVFYSVDRNGVSYSLMFTSLPMINVQTRGRDIVSSPAIMTKLTIADTTGKTRLKWSAVSIRGAYTSTLPKKSYKVVFYTDSTGKSTKDTALFGMREDSEWLLLAMYTEPLRVNNVTSYALWLKMHKLYYASQEADAVPGIRTRYVDVFLNGVYTGLYLLTEPIDRKQLKLKKTSSNGMVRGELYKSVDWTDATLFTGVPSLSDANRDTWAGYELKYPNDTTFWTNLYGLTNFVVNSTDEQFKSGLNARWQTDNLIDYFLFLNLVRAADNRGKNLYIARYKEDEPYIYVPWDLDGTLGNMWAGYRDDVTTYILSNGLYEKLLRVNPGSFKERAKTRWFALRKNIFDAAALKGSLTTNVQRLVNDGAYSREGRLWPTPDIADETTYATNWIDRRLAYLDGYFTEFPDVCSNQVAPTIMATSSTVTQGQSVTLTAIGCAYTTTWNTGATGNTLVTAPAQTTSYTAVCVQTTATNCKSPASTPLLVTVVPGDSTTAMADLSVMQYSDASVMAIGQRARLTIGLTNDGPATARNVRLQNRLPAGIGFLSVVEGSVTVSNSVVDMAVDSVKAGQTILFTYDVQPTVAATYRNAVQVLSSGTLDPDSEPGSGTGDGEDDMALTSIRTAGESASVNESPNPYQHALPAVQSNQPKPDSASADLSLRLAADRLYCPVNGQITLTIEVHNRGGLGATGVVTELTLPDGLSFVSGDGFVAAGNKLTNAAVSLAAGEKRQLSCVVQAADVGHKTIAAQILQADQHDPDSTPGNGTANGEDDEDQLSIRVMTGANALN
ncbi:CotH kinase family protein [Spirosoma oryzae]|uniref:CotH kinase family protein n=1 Tax=Spirosoma oryzae TaxID=1469603 RepID=UPI001474F7BB|nr:CotH kinase family protein [Spirosoma oryzae]